MVSLVEEQVSEPVVLKKVKKNKKRKLENENEAPAAETVLDVNFNPDAKQKKKKKKNKENVESAIVEESVASAVEEPVKKKKKKSKEKPTENDASDEAGETEESGPFKKKFYSISAETEAMTKAEVKSYQSEHNITMYGKGRKTFKPLRTFKELGFSDGIMKVTAGFKAPTPIQAQCWPVLASGRDIIGIAETGSGKTLAFSIPALAHLKHRVETEGRAKKGSPMMLIIAPTRELAMQSQVVLEQAGSNFGLSRKNIDLLISQLKLLFQSVEPNDMQFRI